MQFCAPLNPLKLLQKRLPGTLGACDEPCEISEVRSGQNGTIKGWKATFTASARLSRLSLCDKHRKVPIAKVYPKLLRPTHIKHHQASWNIMKHQTLKNTHLRHFETSYHINIISLVSLSNSKKISHFETKLRFPAPVRRLAKRKTGNMESWTLEEQRDCGDCRRWVESFKIDFHFCRLCRLSSWLLPSSETWASSPHGQSRHRQSPSPYIISFHIFVWLIVFLS